MRVLIDRRVLKFLNSIDLKDSEKAFEYIELFERFGFGLDQRYLKKVKGTIWELRPKNIRLFLIVKPRQVIIHACYKKSQKIRLEDMEVTERRMGEYL